VQVSRLEKEVESLRHDLMVSVESYSASTQRREEELCAQKLKVSELTARVAEAQADMDAVVLRLQEREADLELTCSRLELQKSSTLLQLEVRHRHDRCCHTCRLLSSLWP
jgi:hypothetical protein